MSSILIIGCSGLLGRALIERLGPSAVGTGRTRLGTEHLALDARDRESVLQVVKRVKPTAIVNLVAERRPAFWSNPTALYAANVATAAHVAGAARSVGADLIHTSTDYVFPSGGPFSIDARHAPTNPYGATKSEAESVLRRIHDDAVIVRMPVLYGRVEYSAECNLSGLVRKLVSTDQPLPLDTWAQRRPTHVDDIAESLARILQSIERWRASTVHLSAKDWYTEFEMGRLAVEFLDLDPRLLLPISKERPERPQRVELQLDDKTPYLSRYRCMREGLAPLIRQYVSDAERSI